MHSSSCDPDAPRMGGGEVLLAIAALVTEGRTPLAKTVKSVPGAQVHGFIEGPHCTLSKAAKGHVCQDDNPLCIKYEKIRSYMMTLWQKSLPLCIDVLLVPNCCSENDLVCNPCINLEPIGSALLLEQWNVNFLQRRTHDYSPHFTVCQLINAVRSQLYFSQLSAWLASPDEQTRQQFQRKSVVYCLTVPGETYGVDTTFTNNAQQHQFPNADLGNGVVVKVSLANLPRSEEVPLLKCSKCDAPSLSPPPEIENHLSVLDDRMQTFCTLKGKHRCEDYDDLDNCTKPRLKRNYLNLNVDSPPSTSRSHFNLDEACTNKKCDKSDGAKCCDSLELSKREFVEVLNVLRQSGPMKLQSQNVTKRSNTNDLGSSNNKQSKGDILLDAILRSTKTSEEDYTSDESSCSSSKACRCVHEKSKRKYGGKPVLKSLYPDLEVDECNRDIKCDKNVSFSSDNRRIASKDNIYIDKNCDTTKKKPDFIKMCDISNVFSLQYLEKRQKVKVKQKISFDNEFDNNIDDKCSNNTFNSNTNLLNNSGIPSALEQAKFRKSLDSAASMVFHSRTGLPLTSSPAPVRRGKNCFDFDSSINSVSAIRSALFSLASCSTDEDSESDCSIVSPCSPDASNELKQREIPQINYRHRGQSSGLLGSFVESVLNGRLEPVSTVHGFSAELGASGSFCPRHVVLPVTVFFYTLGDNDKVSTPYLGHINLGKKGYNVPKSGTIQVTLFNPLGTVVKMFVIMYDLSDMPPNSQTFIRQRTLFMPANCEDKNLEWSQKWLRYLIHLRFMSSKSGRIYLHSDIRMIICRKSDLDTATAHGIDMSYELRSFINSPTNPRFSPRK